MWHRQLWARLNHWLVQREAADPSSTTYLKGRLECLDPRLFRQLVIARACVTDLEVELPRITAYVRLLHHLNTLDWSAQPVNLRVWDIRKQTVTVEAFFVDERGCFLDAESEVRQFKAELLQLLQKFDPSHIGAPDALGHNARIAQSLIRSATPIAVHLLQFALQ